MIKIHWEMVEIQEFDEFLTWAKYHANFDRLRGDSLPALNEFIWPFKPIFWHFIDFIDVFE